MVIAFYDLNIKLHQKKIIFESEAIRFILNFKTYSRSVCMNELSYFDKILLMFLIQKPYFYRYLILLTNLTYENQF